MSRQGEYELVPSTDDPNAPPPSLKDKAPLLGSRKARLAVLAVVVVVLLSSVYKFWFGDTEVNTGHPPPDQDSKEGLSTTLSSTSLASKPTHTPSEGSDKGGEETMPTGKLSVG